MWSAMATRAWVAMQMRARVWFFGSAGRSAGEQGNGVVLNCGGGETVGEDDNEVAWGGVKESRGSGGEGSAEVGAPEIGGTVGRGAGEDEDWFGQRWEPGAQVMGEVFGVECGVDGVAGLGVG